MHDFIILLESAATKPTKRAPGKDGHLKLTLNMILTCEVTQAIGGLDSEPASTRKVKSYSPCVKTIKVLQGMFGRVAKSQWHIEGQKIA